MDAWTIRYTDTDGTPVQLNPMPEDEAKALLDDVRRCIDPAAELADLISEAQQRLPLGARVHHVGTDLVGTVVAEDGGLSPFNRAPVGVQISHYAMPGYPNGLPAYTAVCVKFGGVDRGWYDAAFIEPVKENNPR